MSEYTFPNGRIVFMTQFKMVGTYRGQMEGTPEALSQRLRRDIAQRAEEEMPPAKPLAVVLPLAGALPSWMCIGEFESRRGVKHKDPDYSSSLYVCWFTDDLSEPLNKLIQQPLSQVDWEQKAEDYNILDF